MNIRLLRNEENLPGHEKVRSLGFRQQQTKVVECDHTYSVVR
ncbi:hypothetical protein CFU_0124 [Collimonas fungivorans Ter331]|uniref:Uncharacterized protein n=1 Tax=Collimonas fungivorans (strain Ter331) TaxID=1005048 RepID=G0AG71_COLFT|nr:hypothetical protein CFU_0124 [Collimonas fungivorans Ter331]